MHLKTADQIRLLAGAVGVLFLASLVLRWPGLVMYDTVNQYTQALEHDYADWHPPIMARTWSLLLTVWPGTAPFFLLQMALWWGGLGLIANALRGRGKLYEAGAVLAVGAFPLFLGWMTVVLKDAQMAACLVMAAGLWAHWRLRGEVLPKVAAAAIALLLAYATLVRGNAVFATVPLACALFGWAGLRRWWARVAIAIAGIVAVLALSPVVNHHFLGATPEHNDRSLPLYDIVAISHRAHLDHAPGLTTPEWAAAERRGCYTPFFWNPYGDDRQCGWIGDKLAFSAGSHTVMTDWARLVVTHPLAYALHRAAHFNTTLRFLVGKGEPDAIPPVDPEPNDVGLGARSNRSGKELVRIAGWISVTPLGWPVVWLTAAAVFLWGIAGVRGLEAMLARALTLSALVMSGSFAVASIACDLRYHLWSMIAVALALITGWRFIRTERRMAGVAIVLAVALVASAARLVVPPVYVPLPPSSAGTP